MDQEVHIVSTQKNIYFYFIEYTRAFDFIDFYWLQYSGWIIEKTREF